MIKTISFRHLLTSFSCFCFITLNAQTLPGNYSTTWSGNSFSGSLHWVQGYMLSGTVNPAGKVYTIAHWDEAGKTCGVYQDGEAVGRISASGFAITSNNTHVFTQGGTSVKKFNFDGSSASQTINMSFTPTYIAANQTYLVVSNNEGNEAVLFKLSTGSQVKKWEVKDPGPIAIDSDNNIWIVSGVRLPEERFERKWMEYDPSHAPRIFKYNASGEKQADSILLYNEWRPACLAIDQNTNQLMVGDDGPKHQVHFFDISGAPLLVKSFGTVGGISAGEPGNVTPLKFWALKGIGTDESGNLYVIIGEDGSLIRSLKPDGELNWELHAANFVDVMNFDPYSDGRILYGKNEIIEMDYGKQEPGTEWSMQAYTQDRTKYPDDPRNFYTALGHEFTSVWPRLIEGEMYMFTAGMYGVKPNVFKFSGKVASPAAYLKLNDSRAFYQDKDGSVWEANGSGILKTPIVAIESNGDLIYGKAEKVSNLPAPFSSVSRILYDEDNDVMFLTGNNGNQLARYDDWSKENRTPTFIGVIADDYHQCVAIAGDYIFTCGVQTRARIKVYSALDFNYMGMLEAGSVVGGPENTGWIDIPYGLNAMKRLNGEYIVAVEDDGKMKSIIFRWCPDGDCLQGEPSVQFNGLVNKTALLPGDSLLINVSAEDENGTIDSIQLYADTMLLSTSKSEVLDYTWKDIPLGKYDLIARAFDNDGLQAKTYPVRIYVTISDTIKPSVPGMPEAKDIATTYIKLTWGKSTDNEELAGYKILIDGQVAYVSGGPDTIYTATGLLPDTPYIISVLAFDRAMNLSDTSQILDIVTKSDGPFSGSPIHIPGIIEAEYFDFGGEGIAYHDTEPENVGKATRLTEGVDLATTSNGFYVGWTEIDEWLRFTVDVEKEGDYDVVFLTAGGSGSIELNFSNGDKAYTATYSNTPDWNIWRTNVRTNIHLLQGVQYLTVNMNNKQFNLDYIEIVEHQTENFQVPENLRVDTMIDQAVTLVWEMGGDVNNIKEYRIYRNGTFLTKVQKQTYTSDWLTGDQPYEFYVTSLNLFGIESDASNVVSVQPIISSDEKAPTGDKELMVYPNPIERYQLYLKFGETLAQQHKTIKIYNVQGQFILATEIAGGQGEFSMAGNLIKEGVYMISVLTEKKVYYANFISK